MKRKTILTMMIALVTLMSVCFAHDDIVGPHFGGDGTIHDNGVSIESQTLVYKPPRTYNKGFNDGLECLILVALEMQIKKERKTFGEIADICRERNGIE